MGPEWDVLVGGVESFGLIVAVAAAGTMAFRWFLIGVVVLWSLRANERGRTHALKLLRLLGAGHRIGLAGHPATPEVTQDGAAGGRADAPP